jgi:hypothetical protein
VTSEGICQLGEGFWGVRYFRKTQDGAAERSLGMHDAMTAALSVLGTSGQGCAGVCVCPEVISIVQKRWHGLELHGWSLKLLAHDMVIGASCSCHMG